MSLVRGAHQTRVGGTFAVRDTSGVNPRLFLMVPVIGLVALAVSRGPRLEENLLGLVSQLLHTVVR
jgi:hypothetical protein